MSLTTTRPRRHTTPKRAVPAERIPAPPGHPLIPVGLRHQMTAFCSRCDHKAVLPLGGPEALCGLCAAAEAVDLLRTTRRTR